MQHRGVGLGLLIAGFGLLVLGLGVWWLRDDALTRAWPTAAGTLHTVSLEKVDRARRYSQTRSADPMPDAVYQHDTVWTVLVDYEFVVGGRTFHGDRATSTRLAEVVGSDARQPSAALQALVKQWVPGQPIQVHYRPGNPDDSHLAFVDNPQISRAQLIGGSCLMAGLLLAGWFNRAQG